MDPITLAAANAYAEKLALGGAIPIPGPPGRTGPPAVPDYSKMDRVVISKNEGEWTADADGYLYVEAGAQSADSGWLRLNVFVNGNQISWNLHSSTLSTNHRIRGSELFPIGREDTVKVIVHYTESRIAPDTRYVIARFIPFRAIAFETIPPDTATRQFVADSIRTAIDDSWEAEY